jgi:DNA end-binding protein Ku
MFEKSYYLEPDSKSPKAYMLLRRALEDTERVAVVQFALRDKTRLGALRIRDDVLMLQALLWADEVREAAFPALDTSIRISAQEREMSAALVESMASDFEPEQFTDDYQAQLRQLIEAKLEKGDALDTEETFGAEAEGGNGEVIDLMEALKRSLDKKRGGGATAQESTDDESAEDEPSEPAKRGSGRSASGKASSSRSSGSRTSAAKKDTGDSDGEDAKSGTSGTRSKSAASKTGAAAKPSTASKAGTASKGTASKTSPVSKTGAAAKSTTKTASTAKTARKGA